MFVKKYSLLEQLSPRSGKMSFHLSFLTYLPFPKLTYFLCFFLAWVGSLASASMFFWAVASVKLCDVTSVSFTCFSGSVLGAVGLILTSLANQLEVLYVTHSLMFGLGTSLMYTPSLIVIARYYGKWRSAATGLVVSCGSLGQLVLSPLLNFFVVSYGISLTFRWLGSAFAVVSILSSLSFYLLDKKTKLERTGAAVEADWRIMAELLKNKSFLLWILVMMICNFTYYIPLIHLVSIAAERPYFTTACYSTSS